MLNERRICDLRLLQHTTTTGTHSQPGMIYLVVVLGIGLCAVTALVVHLYLKLVRQRNHTADQPNAKAMTAATRLFLNQRIIGFTRFVEEFLPRMRRVNQAGAPALPPSKVRYTGQNSGLPSADADDGTSSHADVPLEPGGTHLLQPQRSAATATSVGSEKELRLSAPPTGQGVTSRSLSSPEDHLTTHINAPPADETLKRELERYLGWVADRGPPIEFAFQRVQIPFNIQVENDSCILSSTDLAAVLNYISALTAFARVTRGRLMACSASVDTKPADSVSRASAPPPTLHEAPTQPVPRSPLRTQAKVTFQDEAHDGSEPVSSVCDGASEEQSSEPDSNGKLEWEPRVVDILEFSSIMSLMSSESGEATTSACSGVVAEEISADVMSVHDAAIRSTIQATDYKLRDKIPSHEATRTDAEAIADVTKHKLLISHFEPSEILLDFRDGPVSPSVSIPMSVLSSTLTSGSPHA